MPWRDSGNPFFIWIAEIMLQQTRIAQGTPYFLRFIHQFPDLKQLACASQDDVLKAWQGLGYYSRARNLHKAAQIMHQNGMPNRYEDWLKLPGVGPYTAAAVCSICFNEQVPAIDGNVIRVISRYFSISQPVDKAEGKAAIRQALDSIFPVPKPGTMNEALMELGALVCTPTAPECEACPVQSGCLSGNPKTALQFPVKSPPRKPKPRFLIRVRFHLGNKTAWIRRNGKDIWQGLYDLPGTESSDEQEFKNWNAQNLQAYFKLPDTDFIEIHNLKHQLTHQTLHIRIFEASLSTLPVHLQLNWYNTDEQARLAIPRAYSGWLESQMSPVKF